MFCQSVSGLLYPALLLLFLIHKVIVRNPTMNSISFGNFQIGQIDDPSNETGGGFEFASGMDIFSEPGVMKACLQMSSVGFGVSATPTATPLWMVDTYDILHSNYRAYVAQDNKILESTDGVNFNLFLTNSHGTIKGLGIWNNYVFYASDGHIGNCPLGMGGSKDDDFYVYSSYTAANYYPIFSQGGTLKVGAGRYITSIDEFFTVTEQAFKLPSDFRITTLAEFLSNAYIGTAPLSSQIDNSSAFAWTGIPLASGSALPNAAFPMNDQGLNALFSDGGQLYAFVGANGDILDFQGSTFNPFRQLTVLRKAGSSLTVAPGAVSESNRTILFGGDTNNYPGVYQMKGGAICQSFIPSIYSPGANSAVTIGFIKSAFNGVVYVGYWQTGGSGAAWHVDRTSATGVKQNGALVKTLWHKIAFGRTLKQRGAGEKVKVWGGIKLNLKPLASGCSVAVAYRTTRDAAFSSTVATINSANQYKPVLFSAAPRSREIQFQLTYTTNGANSPELLSYDPLFDITSSLR
jgi:hypothetical protein